MSIEMAGHAALWMVLVPLCLFFVLAVLAVLDIFAMFAVAMAVKVFQAKLSLFPPREVAVIVEQLFSVRSHRFPIEPIQG